MTFKGLILLAVIATIVAGGASWMWIRNGKPVFIAANKLSYPCLRIIDGKIWDRIDSSQGLHQISSNRFMNRREDPLVIDSKFNVFEMSQLKMRGSTLGLLITGPRQVEVEFELIVRRDKSIQDAKEMAISLVLTEPALTDHSKEFVLKDPSLRQILELLQEPNPSPSLP
jgi:hypothetical protein